MVWLYSAVTPPNSHRKLHHPWTGPYQILSKLSDLNYKIAPTHDLCRTSIVHFDRLKKCHSGSQFPTTCMSRSSPSLFTHTTSHNIGEDAELVDGSEEVQPDNLDDTLSPMADSLNTSLLSSRSSTPPVSHSSTPPVSRSSTPPVSRYPSRHRLPPDRGPFISH